MKEIVIDLSKYTVSKNATDAVPASVKDIAKTVKVVTEVTIE